MKRNQIYKYPVFLLMLILIFPYGATSYAQNKNKDKNFRFVKPKLKTEELSKESSKNKTKKIITVELKSIITDENGKPIPNATVSAFEGSLTIKTAIDGSFTILAGEKSQVLVEAIGYEDKMIVVMKNANPGKITLKKTVLYSGMKDQINLPGGIQVSKRNLVGAVSSIKGEAINSYPDAMLSNMLQGKLLGLRAEMSVGGLANNPSSLSIRGNQRGGSNSIVTIVDGMERPIDDLLPEEIESIEVLKDVTAKIFYGARAANGVLLITTKHGDKLKKIIKTSIEYGYGQVTRTPEYLNSYDYARLYNQARQHDGLTPLYSATDLEGYKNSTGTNDFRYPNVDFNNYFLNNFNNYRKITNEFSGGDEQTQYSLVAGYTGTDGLEKVGVKPQFNRFNIRGNLDVKINDMISGFIGIAGQIGINDNGPIAHNTMYNTVNTTRPNEYPLIIDAQIIKPDSLGIPALGASFTHPNNLYGILQYGGFAKDQNVNGQTNFGLNFDLSKYLKGLSAKGLYTLDNSFYGNESMNTAAATYAQRYYKNSDGTEQMIPILLQKTNINDDVILSNVSNNRSTGWIANVNYNNKFGLHALNIDLSNVYLKQEISGSGQDIKTVNYTFRGNYSYNNKYIVEGDLAYMGSSKFIGVKRYQLFYAGGLAWIMSEENFFKSFIGNRIDYLKVKASAGLMGYDDTSTTYQLYQNRWINQNLNNDPLGETKFDVIGNPNLVWEKSRQFNVGFEGLAFGRKLSVEANYFNELSFDQIQKVDALYSSLYGGLYPSVNWGKVANQGFELEIRWTNKTVGGLGYSLGGNMLYSKNKVLNADEVNYPDDYLRMTNQPSDAMFGYVTEGIFGKDIQLQGHAKQTFGAYGNGDIAYKDLNNDGVINSLDRKILGNSLPRVTLGFDLNFNYKGWGLYALATANLGVSSWLNNSYYWMSGEDKYSVKALESYDVITNPSGKYPALSTTTSSNNLMNSDMWIENSSFIRLKNVELSYSIYNKNQSTLTKSIKIFTRGTNLLLLSKIKDLDPEALNAGVENYPVLTNFTAGVLVSF